MSSKTSPARAGISHFFAVRQNVAAGAVVVGGVVSGLAEGGGAGAVVVGAALTAGDGVSALFAAGVGGLMAVLVGAGNAQTATLGGGVALSASASGSGGVNVTVTVTLAGGLMGRFMAGWSLG
jgi:hypothetical protein